MYLSESCRTAINLEKPCRTLKSLVGICSCMRGNLCIWRQSVGCGEFGLKLVWWKCEWPLVGQLRILGLTAAVIYVRPVQKKTAVVLYNWYFKESITSVLQQQQKLCRVLRTSPGAFYAMVVMVSYTCAGAAQSLQSHFYDDEVKLQVPPLIRETSHRNRRKDHLMLISGWLLNETQIPWRDNSFR